VDSYLAQPGNEKSRRAVGEWLVAARILVERGEFVRDLDYRVPVPVKSLDASAHELDTNPRPRLREDKHLMPVAFGDESILVDFEGGLVTHTREIRDGETIRKESLRDECAVELLIMRPDGKMIAHNTVHDGKNEERILHSQAFLERIDKLRNPRIIPGG